MENFLMPDYTSTYELPNRYNSAESIYFTRKEANVCKIVSTTKVYFNSVFNHWEFKVIDKQGNTYTWKDFRCLEGSNTAGVKSAILNHLTSNVVKVTEDENNANHLKTITTVSDRGQNEYVGAV